MRYDEGMRRFGSIPFQFNATDLPRHARSAIDFLRIQACLGWCTDDPGYDGNGIDCLCSEKLVAFRKWLDALSPDP